MNARPDTLDLSVMGHHASARHVKGQRPALVLLHGAGCDRHLFDELVPRLFPFEIVVPDLPGRNGSDAKPAETVAEAAAFVAKLLDALSIERAIVVGHSYGGAVALELGISHKERVAGLVLVSTGARLRVHPAILAVMQAAADAGPKSIANLPWLSGADPALVERIERHVVEVPSKTTLSDWRAANDFDRMAEVKAIECPALVVTGTQDALTRPKYARWLVENLAEAELSLIEGAGHMLPVEHAPELALEILPWVQKRFGTGTRA